MRNDRFGDAVRASGLGFPDLAEQLNVNAKTVQRWFYEGRVPHPRAARRAAEILGEDVRWLWPSTGQPQYALDVIRVYSDLTELPHRAWQRLVEGSRTRIWLAVTHPGVIRIVERISAMLSVRADDGVDVRVLVTQGVQLGPLSLRVEVRERPRRPSAQVLVFDDDIVVPLAQPTMVRVPILQMHRTGEDGAFDSLGAQFEAAWGRPQLKCPMNPLARMASPVTVSGLAATQGR